MKRPFSRNPSAFDRSRFPWMLGAVIVGVLVILFLIRIFVPGFFVVLASPFWKTGTSLDAATSGYVKAFEGSHALAQENLALEEQNDALLNENRVLTARAQDLTKLLGGVNAASGETSGSGTAAILAGVLARPPESPYDTLVVGKGSADGVIIGAQVFGQDGIPLGTIKHVTSHSAQVSLYSSPGRTTDAWVGSNRIPVTIIGAGAGAFTASLPSTSAVAVGDSLYLSGPGAIPIGSVSSILRDPSSPTVTLQIQPYENFFSVTWVEIASS